MFIKNNSAWINIEMACSILSLSKSAYYDWLSNYEKYLIKVQLDQEMAQKVVNAFNKSHKTYGATRILKALHKNNVACSYQKILEIMKVNDLIPIGNCRYRVTTTNSNHKYKVFDNLLERNFIADKPDVAWVGDITYVRTNEGWLYLATVIDIFSRRVIGYKMSSRMARDLVIGALLMALKARNYPTGVIVHSDRGSQYASNDYKAILAKYHLFGSMSRKGDCWDNAVAESFFATIKKEYIYQTTFKTRIDAQLGIFDYIEAWYNTERIHSHLDYISPNEFELCYQQKLAKSDQMVNSGSYLASGI